MAGVGRRLSDGDRIQRNLFVSAECMGTCRGIRRKSLDDSPCRSYGLLHLIGFGEESCSILFWFLLEPVGTWRV